MGQQQLLLVILGVIIVGFAIAIGISLFGAQSVSSNRDAMINDINHLSMVAYQFRISLRSMGGGEGDFSTFVIPLQMKSNSNGLYSVTNAQVNTLTFKATSANDASNTITVTVDSNGRLGSLTFGGDFQ
ncbi:MAG: hypothetical protein NTU47_07800 [Ignavibacteriales bacterium]|nr:hypothetical protein [Ignavibacteriales bacterium]